MGIWGGGLAFCQVFWDFDACKLCGVGRWIGVCGVDL